MLGAGLFGANLSSIFRLRQFGMADKTPYSVAIQLEHEQGGRAGGVGCGRICGGLLLIVQLPNSPLWKHSHLVRRHRHFGMPGQRPQSLPTPAPPPLPLAQPPRRWCRP